MGFLNNKLLTLGGVFVISSFLYFSLFNHYVLENKKSSASVADVTVSFNESNVTINNPATDPVEVNMFFNSGGNLLSGSTTSFQYSPELRYDSPTPGNDVISALCHANGFEFKQLLTVNFDDNTGVGNIARSVVPANPPGLPSGYFCNTTLTFRYKNVAIPAPGNASIKLWDPTDPTCDRNSGQYNPMCHWEIVGPDAAGQPVFYNPVLDPNKSTVQVSISSVTSNIPTPTPTVGPNPNSCRALPYPANVPNPSGSTVVLPLAQACGNAAVYNSILTAIQSCYGSPSPACGNWDFNGDGVVNQTDYDLFVLMCWCTNNGYGPGGGVIPPAATATPVPPTATPTPEPSDVSLDRMRVYVWPVQPTPGVGIPEIDYNSPLPTSLPRLAYSTVVTNIGTTIARNVSVVFELDELYAQGGSFVSADVQCSFSNATKDVTCNRGDMPPRPQLHSQHTYGINVVGPTAPGVMRVTATATPTNDDTDLSNNTVFRDVTFVSPTPTPTATPLPTATPTLPPALATVTPLPLPSATLVPTGGNCTRRPEGDFNCDTKVNLIDFNQWLGAFINYLQTGFNDPHFDLNNDNKPSLYEFEIIRSHYDFS